MKLRTHIALLLVCASAPILAGCGRNIVRAASPSVVTAPPVESSAASGRSEPAPEPIPAPEIPQPAAELAPAPAVEPEPPRPRPAPVAAEPEPPQPVPAVAPPQISPMLTPADQERLTRLATDQIRVAERNLQSPPAAVEFRAGRPRPRKCTDFSRRRTRPFAPTIGCAPKTWPRRLRFFPPSWSSRSSAALVLQLIAGRQLRHRMLLK